MSGSWSDRYTHTYATDGSFSWWEGLKMLVACKMMTANRLQATLAVAKRWSLLSKLESRIPVSFSFKPIAASCFSWWLLSDVYVYWCDVLSWLQFTTNEAVHLMPLMPSHSLIQVFVRSDQEGRRSCLPLLTFHSSSSLAVSPLKLLHPSQMITFTFFLLFRNETHHDLMLEAFSLPVFRSKKRGRREEGRDSLLQTHMQTQSQGAHL